MKNINVTEEICAELIKKKKTTFCSITLRIRRINLLFVRNVIKKHQRTTKC